jgi:hypothetical protein
MSFCILKCVFNVRTGLQMMAQVTLLRDMYIALHENLPNSSAIITAHSHTPLIQQSRSPACFITRQTTAATTANLSPHFGQQRNETLPLSCCDEETRR